MYFYDSYAIIEHINNKPAYHRFNSFEIITNTLNLCEAHYILSDLISIEYADNAIINLKATILQVTKEIAIKASKMRFINKKLKLSYADCIGYACAIENDLKFLTGDDGMKSFEDVEFVK